MSRMLILNRLKIHDDPDTCEHGALTMGPKGEDRSNLDFSNDSWVKN